LRREKLTPNRFSGSGFFVFRLAKCSTRKKKPQFLTWERPVGDSNFNSPAIPAILDHRGDFMRNIFLFILIIAAAPVFAQGQTAKVISIIDGNTIEVSTSANETYRIVLAGIDCPELTQEYGEKAKKFLDRALAGEEVEFQIQGKDRWGNYLAIVTIKGEDPRIDLLKEGLAWTSERNPDPELESYRVIAQEKGKGLWKEEDATPPWIYRRQQTMLQPKSS
jgi:micrococcal nuclease